MDYPEYMDLNERDARILWSTLAEPGDDKLHQWRRATGSWADAIRGLIDPETTSFGWTESTRQARNARYEEAWARWKARLAGNQLARTKQQLERWGIDTVTPEDSDWPVQVNDLADLAPIILYTRGDRSLLTSPRRVAIIGARAATGYGEYVAMTLGSGLAERGVVVVSGAAYGIDGMAHRSVLAASGKTIAVLAGGPDRFYPAGHDELIERIKDTGLVVSEMPPGSSPTRWRFLQRNRIIAALSNAVVVVEAGLRSGSLNTVRHAVTIDRLVFAVPGPVTSAASAGTHQLIIDGDARLTMGDVGSLVEQIYGE